MKKHLSLLILGILVGFFGYGAQVFAIYTDNDGVDINLSVDCNLNNICESGLGETVLNCPNDCTPTQSPQQGGGDSQSFGQNYSITFVEATTTTTTAVITWVTPIPMLSQLSWGVTYDYERGSMSEVTYSFTHKVTLTNLMPGTQYYFRITGTSIFGAKAVSDGQVFKTLPVFDVVSPSPVRDIQAFVFSDNVQFVWLNPTESDYAYTRVVRTRNYYPKHYTDGEIVYEAGGNNFKDTDVRQGRYYYAFFTRYRAGNYSTGVVRAIDVPAPSVPIKPVMPFDPEPITPQSPNNIPDVPPSYTDQGLPEYLTNLKLTDFIFSQNGKEHEVNEKGISVNRGSPILVTVKNDHLPNFLRTITLHIQDPKNSKNYTSYLLQFDPERNVYQAEIPAGDFVETTPFRIIITDTDNKVYKEFESSLLLSEAIAQPIQAQQTVMEKVVQGALAVAAGLFLWLSRIFFLVKRR